MHKIVKIILLILVVEKTQGQPNGDITAFIYDRVYKNVVSYNLINNDYAINGYNKGGYLTSVFPFFEAFVPDKNFHLNMIIDRTKFNYPKKDFVLYSIYIEKLSFTNETGDTTIAFGGGRSALKTSTYLIALDSIHKEVKYISGDFFLSKIASDFSFSATDEATLTNYIRLKCFNLQIDKLILKRKQRTSNYFVGYSNTLQRNVRISVNSRNFELIKIDSVSK